MKAEGRMTNGECPKVKLADVAEQCLGKMLDAKKNKGRLMPYLRNPNVRWFDVDTSDLQLMPFEDHEHERYGLKAGDIVICEGGEAGRAAIWDGRLPDLKFQKAIHRVRPGPRLHNRFFVHRLMADHQNGRLGDYLTGATIKHFTGQDLARYEFPLPPLTEQRRIAEVLDRAEALRAKRRAALAQLDSLTQSLFLDLFGDPATNPKGWDVARLGGVASTTSGGTPKRDVGAYFGGAIPWVKSGELHQAIVTGTEEFLTERGLAESSAKLIETGAVLVAMYGATVGAVALLGIRAATNQAICCITVSPKLGAPFLVSLLKWLTPSLLAKRVGGAQPNLSQDLLRNLVIPVPPIALQREFARRVTAVEALKTAQRASLAELDALFATLQHRAFRGEL